jgi:hypothetical protein
VATLCRYVAFADRTPHSAQKKRFAGVVQDDGPPVRRCQFDDAEVVCEVLNCILPSSGNEAPEGPASDRSAAAKINDASDSVQTPPMLTLPRMILKELRLSRLP